MLKESQLLKITEAAFQRSNQVRRCVAGDSRCCDLVLVLEGGFTLTAKRTNNTPLCGEEEHMTKISVTGLEGVKLPSTKVTHQ